MNEFFQPLHILCIENLIDFPVGLKQLLSPASLNHSIDSFLSYCIGEHSNHTIDFIYQIILA